MVVVFHVPHSHLYPGLRGRLVPDEPLTELALRGGIGTCVVEFADGPVATGSLGPEEDGCQWLSVQGYTTSRGTKIPAKRCGLDISLHDPRDASFQVIRRGQP